MTSRCRPREPRYRTALAVVIGLLVALAGIALARPGGGQSFSGGGSRSSGGGFSSSGGGGSAGDAVAIFEIIYYVIILIVDYPYIAGPLIIGVAIWLVVSWRQQRANRDWDSGPAAQLPPPVERVDTTGIDPDFSRAVFEDFAFRLFATAHRARVSADALAAVAPYVSEAARQALAAREPVATPVQAVIVGALRIVNVVLASERADGRVNISVEYEANVMTAEHTYYSVETWLFARAGDRRSKPPGATKTFPCPNCGAPWQAAAMGTQKCATCGEIVDNGRFDWSVETISLASIDERPPTVTQDVPERGTSLPTIVDRNALQHMGELTAADPNVTDPSLEKRLKVIYDALNTAWSNNDLTAARPFVSDALYDYLQYWIDTYKRQSLRNQLTDMHITRMQLAKVERDRWYDAVTIRLWATGKDFVINTQTGRVLRGSKHSERPYSEYWTLMRSAGRKGEPQPSATCNNCGAPLRITMGGDCEHCGAHVTAGEFDWVVSKIEQDETYGG